MKTEIVVTEINHEELVNLLSMALDASSWFEADYNSEVYNSLTDTNGDCFEDKLADMLIAGHNITITDYYAEGMSYSTNFVKFEGKYDNAVYEVCLKDFLEVASTRQGFELIKQVLDGDGDYWTADAFLQRVVFGEEVYG